jgi:hypothetical protein
MRHAHRLRLLAAVTALLGAVILSSCVTSSGGTFAKTAGAEQAARPPQGRNPPGPPPVPANPAESVSPGVTTTPARGLLVVTNPTDAEVYINGRYMGRTPLVLEDLDRGAYQLTLRKDGYYEVVSWVNFSGESMRYESNLVRVTGFLQLTVSPPESEITVGGQSVSSGMIELPTGSYDLRIRAFGYGEHHEQIVITEKGVTPVSAELSPVAFSISRADSSKSAVNPANPGILGTLEVSWEVSGPGTGEVAILGPSGETVFKDTLPDFTTWSQRYTWVPRGASGAALDDGEYRLVISGRGPDLGEQETAEVPFRIDRSGRISARSSWSGSSGLLFAPSAEILPAESFQVMFLGAGGPHQGLLRAPLQLSARIGIANAAELGIEAGVILTEQAAPISAGVSGKLPLLRAGPGGGFSAAVEAKAALQVDPASGILLTDTFTNFTGVSVGIPLQLTGGPLSALIDGGIIGSLWTVSYSSIAGSQSASPAVWLYLRAGLLLDLGSVTGGVSLAARTQPLPDLTIAFPFQAGAELHWLIPGTHLLASAVFLGEVDDKWDYYFLGGGGLGFLY